MTALVLILLAVEPHRLDSRREAGAESCPDEVALQRAVAERLGSSPFTPDAARTVTVRWRASSGAFSSEVTVTSDTGAVVGSKKLTSTARDCAELGSSTALTLALILDPLSLTRPPPSSAEPAPVAEPERVEPPPPAPPIVVVEREPAPAPVVIRESPKSGLWLGAGAGLSLLEVPNVSAAVELSVAGKWTWVMFGARASFVAPGAKGIDEGSVSAMVVGAGPFLCIGTSRAGGCAALRLGVTHAWASGFTSGTTYSATAPSLAVSLGPYLDFNPTASLKLRLFANAQLQPAAAVLVVRTHEAWRTPIFGFSAGVAFFGSP